MHYTIRPQWYNTRFFLFICAFARTSATIRNIGVVVFCTLAFCHDSTRQPHRGLRTTGFAAASISSFTAPGDNAHVKLRWHTLSQLDPYWHTLCTPISSSGRSALFAELYCILNTFQQLVSWVRPARHNRMLFSTPRRRPAHSRHPHALSPTNRRLPAG